MIDILLALIVLIISIAVYSLHKRIEALEEEMDLVTEILKKHKGYFIRRV